MQDEKRALKTWLRQLREDQQMSQEDVSALLGVDVKTIKNLESPKQGFSHGLTVLRYLRLLGVVADSPAEPPGLGRLAALEATVDRTGAATTSALEDLGVRIQRVEQELKLPAARATEASR